VIAFCFACITSTSYELNQGYVYVISPSLFAPVQYFIVTSKDKLEELMEPQAAMYLKKRLYALKLAKEY